MLFTDSLKILKTTGVTSNKADYKNESKVKSIRKMKHIQFESTHR